MSLYVWQYIVLALREPAGGNREEAERTWVYTNPHFANKCRENGLPCNVPEFYEAFPEIQPGDALYRNASQRPVIW
ncbi:MAG: hypothetical protein GYA23_10085 [Methanomicrobiales archaeon]|nr:hypothetical protein [Methanomicrobiales archaeon]